MIEREVIEIFKVIMIVGSLEIEEVISAIPSIHTEILSDIDLIQEILEYEKYDYVIVNSLLSKRKIVQLADYIDNMESAEKPKIIVLAEDMKDKKFITQLVGFGVTAFVKFNELGIVAKYIENYPENFSLSVIEDTVQGKEIPVNTVINGTISIGVFSIDRGAGSTTSSLKIAEEIANCGYRVVCVEIGRGDFRVIKKRKRNLELISIERGEKDAILQAAYSDPDYQFLIVDFGQIIEFDKSGNLLRVEQDIIGDFLRCNYKVGMGFSSLWHTPKLELFLKHDFFQADMIKELLFFILSGETAKQAVEDYHEFSIWHRENFEDFIYHLKINIGIQNVIKIKNQGIRWKLWRGKG